MSVGQSNSPSQLGTYGTSNTSQLPPQGANNGFSQTRNSHSPQNGIANTSEPPSASVSEIMEFSADPEILQLHNAIARGAQPNGGGETHPAVESASNVSTLSANIYGSQRPFTMASSLTTLMTDTDREELGLNGTGTGNDGEALPNIPTISMERFMTDESDFDLFGFTPDRNSNEISARMDALQIDQRDGSVTTSHTIVNGNSAPRDSQPTRISDYFLEVDPATQQQWQRLRTSDPVRRQNTPIPTSTRLGRVDDLPSVHLSNLRLGPLTEGQRAAYVRFIDTFFEHEAGSAAPGEETAASNQADRPAPAPRRNPRNARRGSGRRGSLRRTTEADQEFWREFSDPE